MGILCNLAHLRGHAVPTELSITDMVVTAGTVDKYDLTSVVRFAALSWLRVARAGTSLEDTVQLAIAAYYFREPFYFRKFTKALVFDFAWSVYELHDHQLGTNAIPIVAFRM